MAEPILDRGGNVGASHAVGDAIPSAPPGSASTKGGGWGNIALLGAEAALVGAIGGITIGYATFHHPASSKAAEQPAKASDRAVADVMASPNAQRAALAGQLGQPGAPATDIFGRPVAATPGQQPTDVNGNPIPTSGQQTPAQTRAQQARAMADAARRSPIMAFGGSGIASGAAPVGAGQPGTQPQGQSTVAPQNFGASGFGPPSTDADSKLAAGKGPNDFSDQLGHATIQTVRASLIPDRSFLLSAGTVIPCTLQTAINSTQAGYVSCVVNHDVFSENGRVVLLDKGTKVLGQYSGGITQGQARMFVLWTRALTPRGVAIDLGSPAADSLGRAGVTGGIDTQFWARFGAALMMSVLEDASNIAGRAVAGQGTYTTQVPSTMGQTILQSTMSIRPILKKNQGDTAAIFVAKDFDFRSVYDVQLRR
ncbi:MAG: type IV secretion system protein VirB10 [Novosphingobium aromaticivorans]|nr:type IV secretion system protein VirB10 [Novosphingobium aromaticivorans]